MGREGGGEPWSQLGCRSGVRIKGLFEPQWMRSRAEKDVEPMMRDEDVRQKTLPRPKQSRKHSQLRAASTTTSRSQHRVDHHNSSARITHKASATKPETSTLQWLLFGETG